MLNNANITPINDTDQEKNKAIAAALKALSMDDLRVPSSASFMRINYSTVPTNSVIINNDGSESKNIPNYHHHPWINAVSLPNSPLTIGMDTNIYCQSMHQPHYEIPELVSISDVSNFYKRVLMIKNKTIQSIIDNNRKSILK